VLVFLVNVFSSRKRAEPTVADPWDARTLEWTIPSPPPAHNYDEVPTVHALDDFWHRKYTEDEEGHLVARDDFEHVEPVAGDGRGVHMPSPSFYPLVASFGLPVIAYGMIYRAWFVSIIGAVIVLAGLYAWAIEPSAEPDDHHVEHPPALGPGDDEGELVAVGAGDTEAPAEQPTGDAT
jgi:cytochrome c oxidase subunit I